MINEELKKYIEENIFPEYELNEKGHGIDHINAVIKRSFDIVEKNNLDVNLNMVYTVAAYHDIGHHIDPKSHEIVSADMLRDDKNLCSFFFEDEIKEMAEAVMDHRASLDGEPRNIYGKIVSTADRNNTVEMCLFRTYTYGKKINGEATDDELFHRSYNHLQEKFGVNGYAKFYFKDEINDKFLKEMQELLEDEDNFCKVQSKYIDELKEKGIL